MWHAATGIIGEAGELIDAIKKHVIYNKPLDHANIVEELGDLEFYMEYMRQVTGTTREETLAQNMAKLGIRYAKGYSDQAAQVRADKNVVEVKSKEGR
jgi:NTP pyrophosphatase (non-canonical NTP hydrolase)